MTCWGKINATSHFISPLFCWCLSVVETLIEQLHEAWDVQSCLSGLKLVVQRKEWSRSLSLRGTSRLRHGNRSWSRPLESMLVLGLYHSTFLIQAVYTAICHATSKTVKTAFIIWNTCCQFFFNVFVRYTTERPEPKRFGTNICTVTPLLSNNNIKQILHKFLLL